MEMNRKQPRDFIA